MANEREIRSIPKIELLFEENIASFNRMVADGKPPDLANANLSGLDLRKARLRGLDLSGSYLRNCDLRGVDLTDCNLHGASLQGAQISGALFPDNVSMDEVRYSVEYGTRIRTCDIRKDLRRALALLTEIYKLLRRNSPGQ